MIILVETTISEKDRERIMIKNEIEKVLNSVKDKNLVAEIITEMIFTNQAAVSQQKDEEIDRLLEENETLELVNKRLTKHKIKLSEQIKVLNKIAGGM